MGIRALLSQIYASKFLRHALLAFLIVALFLGGIQLRRWIGESTRHVRYQHDIVNAFFWFAYVWGGSLAQRSRTRLVAWRFNIALRFAVLLPQAWHGLSRP